MKTIKKLNTFAVGLPLVILITYPFFKEGSLFFALLSTMVTGLIQIILGIILLFKFTGNIHYKIYFINVLLFFALWIWSPLIHKIDYFTYTLIYIPPILAIYLSILIYKIPNS